jgi:hypothetical protein
MKIAAFTKRLMRDLREQDPAQMTADTRLELLDAINGTIQQVNSLAPFHSRITTAALELAAPVSVTLAVEKGSNQFTGYLATDADLYCTIRIDGDGDGADNQLTGSGDLLFGYAGETGTVQATIYHDALTLPQTIAEITGQPMLIENRTELIQDAGREMRGYQRRAVETPRYWWVEPNAMISNPPSPAIFRVNSLPPVLTRIEVEVLASPARIRLEDMLAGDVSIPFRDDVIESYLLPITRGVLAESELWRNNDTRTSAIKRGESALSAYATLTSAFLTTPEHRCGTPRGF